MIYSLTIPLTAVHYNFSLHLSIWFSFSSKALLYRHSPQRSLAVIYIFYLHFSYQSFSIIQCSIYTFPPLSLPSVKPCSYFIFLTSFVMAFSGYLHSISLLSHCSSPSFSFPPDILFLLSLSSSALCYDVLWFTFPMFSFQFAIFFVSPPLRLFSDENSFHVSHVAASLTRHGRSRDRLPAVF